MRTGMVVFAVVILALGLTGVAYAHWSETLYIQGTVNTGTVDAELSVGCGWDSEPDYKDVSSITGTLSMDKQTLTVTINNAYPCIDYWLPIDVHCTGSVPVHVYLEVTQSNLPLGTVLEITPDPQQPVGLVEGVQLHYCDAAWGILHVHIPQEAAQSAQYTFTITLTAIQWNVEPTPPPQPNPAIGLSPTSLTFNATEEGDNPPSQPVTVSNTGSAGSTLNWSATDNADWLSESPTSGSLANGASEPMTVSVDITGLASGTYNATITVSDPNATNNPQTVDVTLEVAPVDNTPPDDNTDNDSFQWREIESWAGTVSSPAVWRLIETWTGTVSDPTRWYEIESWTGTVTTPTVGWQLMESWSGTVVSSTPTWQLVESWTGTLTVTAPTVEAWRCVESWTCTVSSDNNEHSTTVTFGTTPGTDNVIPPPLPPPQGPNGPPLYMLLVTVLDNNGEPVVGATVTVVSLENSITENKVTDNNGNAVFMLPAGEYVVTVFMIGYGESQFTVVVGQTTELDVVLESEVAPQIVPPALPTLLPLALLVPAILALVYWVRRIRSKA